MFASKDIFLTPPSGGYTIARSVRFRSSATAYFNRTPASTPTSWTWSGWVKRGKLTTTQAIAYSRKAGSVSACLFFNATDQIAVDNGATQIITNAVYRDASAWYHIVVNYNGTTGNIYVNGVSQSYTSSLSGANQFMNSTSGVVNAIGEYGDASLFYFDGYLTEINFIDGQALTPSSFGSTNSITGVWQPAKYTGTYGTNGFYLNFSDNSNNTSTTIGKDYSGNGNNWTPNNISVTAGVTYDSMTDVPTLTSLTAANYAVFNPLEKGSIVTISDGNLKYSSNGSSGTNGPISMRISAGMKSYFEFTCGSAATYRNVYISGGVTYTGDSGSISGGTGGSGTFATWTTGDVIAFACDFNNATIACYKNNTLQTTITGVTNTSEWTIIAGQAIGLGEFYFNAGQRPFSYTPPTGFVALNTYNLPASTIKNGAAYMAATTYTGNGSTQSISNAVNGVSFQPDWLWVKERSEARSNLVWDSVRGSNLGLITNTTSAESAQPSFTGFLSNGFGVSNTDASDITNKNAQTYVGWQWKAGGTAVSNTAGSITSTVSANPTAGFSVVTYTGTGANATVGHGLGVAPSMIIVKSRSLASTDWFVYNSNLTSNSYYLRLSTTDAQASSSAVWNSTSPTSSVFSLGTSTSVNGSTYTYVAYCFAAVAGYSAFGSFVGNGSADGPFCYTGFRPRFVIIKNSTTAGTDWDMYDSSRSTYNQANAVLRADTSGAELSILPVDFLSNGFKIRDTGTDINTSSATMIYMAFAEDPFKNSLAR